MKFAYTALTKDSKKITGVFDVESQEAAQAELHKMGVAIIAVNEVSEEEYEKLKKEQKEVKKTTGIQTFDFLGVDPNKKEIEGTIDSADDFSAYKRLRTEYQLEVRKLYKTGATETEIQTANGLLLNFEVRLETESPEVKKKDEDEESEDEINKEIIKEVDKVVINAKKAIEEHKDLYGMELLKEINSTLGELQRIRSSNNIKHITEVSNDLYALVSNPDKLEEGVGNKEYQSILNEIQDSALVKKEFELYKKAIKLGGVKKVFEGITKKLKSITKTTDEEEKKAGFITKTKDKIHNFLEKFTKKKKVTLIKKEEKPKGRFGLFFEKLTSYFKTTSPILQKTRRKELMKAFKAIFTKKKKETKEPTDTAEEKGDEAVEASHGVPDKTKPTLSKKTKKKRDFTKIFVEADSFAGWLLCFYIIYFFLVSFSLEKDIGLSREFIFKTLKSPILLNITIFLLLIHFTLRMKNLHFRQNAIAAFFLIAFSLSIYTLLIVNF